MTGSGLLNPLREEKSSLKGFFDLYRYPQAVSGFWNKVKNQSKNCNGKLLDISITIEYNSGVRRYFV